MHQRSIKDRLHREQAGQWVRLPDDIPANVAAIKDELRGEFVAYYAPGTASNTYGIIEVDNVIQLPTGTPSVVESPVYIADIHEIGADLSEDDPVRAIRNVGVDTYDANQVNWECNLDGAGSGGGTPEIGCGLEYEAGTGDLIVDVDALAGKGIKAGDSAMHCDDFGADGETYCCLYVDVGCGLQYNSEDGDIIEVDVEALAGKGLAVGTDSDDCITQGINSEYCCLYVNIGCGLKFDESTPPKVIVDVEALAGDGLGTSFSSGDCDAQGVDGNYCCLKVNVGCGLDIVADTVVVDNGDLAGSGLTTEGECALAANVDETYITINESNQITLIHQCIAIEKDSITCTLEQDVSGDLKLTINWDNCDGSSGSTSCTLSGTTTCGE